MLIRKLGSLGAVLAASLIVVACSSPPEEVEAAAEALTSDSVGLVCRTLGEIGQCASSSLCSAGVIGTCKAKDWALRQDQSWGPFCNSYATVTNCGYANQYCAWQTAATCSPRNGTPATPGPVDISATCNALGELGGCGGVPACKSAIEGVCQATDDAIAFDPQWQQMCPRAGTSPEACDAQGTNCFWADVETCSARGSGKLPLDVGTACKTLGQAGACGRAASVCKTRSTGLCGAKPEAAAASDTWEPFCNSYSTATNCGYANQYCRWAVIDDCVPLAGARPESAVDTAKACDTFGQIGVCSRAPICKVIASAACRATAGALAADPEWANQCARASTSKDSCDFLAPGCAWVPATACIPR